MREPPPSTPQRHVSATRSWLRKLRSLREGVGIIGADKYARSPHECDTADGTQSHDVHADIAGTLHAHGGVGLRGHAKVALQVSCQGPVECKHRDAGKVPVLHWFVSVTCDRSSGRNVNQRLQALKRTVRMSKDVTLDGYFSATKLYILPGWLCGSGSNAINVAFCAGPQVNVSAPRTMQRMIRQFLQLHHVIFMMLPLTSGKYTCVLTLSMPCIAVPIVLFSTGY